MNNPESRNEFGVFPVPRQSCFGSRGKPGNFAVQLPPAAPADLKKYFASFMAGQAAKTRPLTVAAGLDPEAFRKFSMYKEHGLLCQAYRLARRKGGIELIAGGAAGLAYGFSTLGQIIGHARQNGLPSEFEVIDWPALEERGFWDYFHPVPGVRPQSEFASFRSFAEWKPFIDKMARLRLNLMELLVVGDNGLYYPSRKFPDLTVRGLGSGQLENMRETMAYAKKSFIKIVPAIAHVEQLKFLCKAYPEIKGRGAAARRADVGVHIPCFSNPRTQAIFTGLIVEIAALLACEEILIWQTESKLACSCPQCRKKGAFYAMVHCLKQAFQAARREGLKVVPRVMVSFLYYDNAPLRMVREELGGRVVYYEGGLRGPYEVSRRDVIPDKVAEAAAWGMKINTCLNFRCQGYGHVPLPIPTIIQKRLQEAEQKRLAGFSASLYSNPETVETNLAAGLGFGWNPKGAEPAELMELYAGFCGRPDPKAYARAVMTAEQAVEILDRRWLRVPGLYNNVEWRLRHLEERKTMDWFEISSAYEEDLFIMPALRKLSAELAEAGRVLQTRCGRKEQYMLGALHHLLGMEIAVSSAYNVYRLEHHTGEPVKGDYRDYRRAIRQLLQAARAHLQQFELEWKKWEASRKVRAPLPFPWTPWKTRLAALIAATTRWPSALHMRV